MEHDDIDEDIERLNIILQDEDGGEDCDSDGELRVLEKNEEDYYSNASRPSTSSDVTASSFPTTSMCTDADDALFKFDPNTITSETCLAMNRAYQEVLLDTLRQIEISLIENRARQSQLEESVNEKVKRSDKQTSKEWKDNRSIATCLPYFKDKSGSVPPYNEDVKLKERMNEEKQHVRPKVGWIKRERKSLVDAVKIDALEQVVRPLLNKQEVEMLKLSRCRNSEEIAEAKERIKKLQEEIKLKQNMPDDELWKSCDNSKIDFLKISCVTFDNKYNPSECESMWNAVLRPGINRNKWKIDEEAKLKDLAEIYSMRNWEEIAKKLKTDRTPYQCLQHYQQKVCISNESEWTEEEDELLREVVETCSYGPGRVKWFQVAYYIDGRTADQCYARWNKIDPKRNLGRWTKEEDKQLLEAIQLQGGPTNWVKIQESVPSRNAAQCRERFVSRMSGDILYKPWTYEDDKKLLKLYQEHGPWWVEIASKFEGRTDNMVLLRHKRLVKWQQLSDSFYSQPKKVQQELKHQAFTIMKTGELVPKTGLSLRIGKKGSIKTSERLTGKKKHRSEVERLKAIGGRHVEESDDDDDDEDDDDDDVKDNFDDLDDEDEELDESKRALQDSLDAFVSLYNIEALDYLRQIIDKKKGGLVVPRPPPIKRNKMHLSQNIWNKQAKLNNVVVSQIDLYIKQLQNQMNESGDESTVRMNLYERISKNIKKGDEKEKKRMITEAFRGKNPCHLSVRELLNISRCIKEHGKPPKNPKDFDKKPWEVETSEEENWEETSESEEEEFQDEEEEPYKEKRPKTEKQKQSLQTLPVRIRKYHDLMLQLKKLVLSKMDPKELNRRGRNKQFLIYPKNILMKYRGLEEERRLNRRSLVLFMKTLDVNTRKAYFKARNGKRKLSALAFLKTAEKANLKRAKTRRQKQEIQESARKETNINTELSEVSDYLLDIKDELKIDIDSPDEQVEEMLAMEENNEQQYGYDKLLPYVPPNRTNMLGMKTLFLEHRYLIDQADMYFNIDELKHKLYDLKKKGPNPLMGVLNAVRKTESASRKQEDRNVKTNLKQQDCRQQMDEVRKSTAYLKLKARFQSIFTWPALMATIQPPKGKPLPGPLQAILQTPGDTEVDIKPEPKDKRDTEDADNNVEEEMEALSEEEAVEKLVDKIMEEYQKERPKRKRQSTAKKHRHFSDKQKKAFVEKERTKILKKLGLYDKMQEFKRRRLEAEQNKPSSTITSTSATSTVTSSTATSTVVPAGPSTLVVSETSAGTSKDVTAGSSAPVVPETSTVTSSTATSTDVAAGPSTLVVSDISTSTSTGVTAGPSAPVVPEALNVTSSAAASGDDSQVVGASKSSTASSDSRNSNDTAVKDSNKDEGPKNLSEGCQADFPLDNTDITENHKNAEADGKRRRGRPVGAKTRCFATGPLRKSKRSRDSDVVVKLEKDYEMSPPKKKTHGSKKGSQYNFVRTLIPAKMSKIASQIPELPILNEPLPESPVKKPREKKPAKEKERVPKSKFSKEFIDLIKQQTGRTAGPKTHLLLKKMQESEAENATSSFVIKVEPMDTDGDTADDGSYTINVKELRREEAKVERIEQKKETSTNNEDTENKIASLEQESTEALTQGEAPQQKRTETESEKNVTVENTKEQTDDTAESQKPLVIAVPVMIEGVQQVACIPFYPDKDGNITLPNGKKIDASSASNTATDSLPVINFDQQHQVLKPSQQTPAAEQQQPGDDDGKKQTPDTSRDSVSLLNLKMTQTSQAQQEPLQNISLLNTLTIDKNTVTTNSSSSPTSSIDATGSRLDK